KVVTRRIPFVMPRSIVLEKGGSGRFELVIGQSFARDAKPPISIFRDVHCDDAMLNLEDVKDDEPTTIEGYPLCRTKIPFDVQESARASPFKTTVKLEFGVPSVEKTVDDEWK